MYRFSRFNAYDTHTHTHTHARTRARTHARTHANAHTHARTHARTHTHTESYIRAMGLKKRFSKKEKTFQGRFKRTDSGRKTERNRKHVAAERTVAARPCNGS